MGTRRAAVYVRISQDRTGAGLGVQRQREDSEALAKRLGWTVVRIYTDNDLSAYSGKPRPEYRAMLDDVATGRVEAIIAWHPDRLHRSPLELEEFISLVEGNRVDVQTVQAGIWDLSTPAGRMTARTLGNMARYESEHKSERITRRHLQKAELGEWRGGTRPFGFLDDAITPHPSEAPELLALTRAVLSGESLASLIRDLNARGIPTTMGKTWSYATLRQMLLRPRNAGFSEYRGQIIGKGKWPALVPEEEWRAVCALLRNPARRLSVSNRPKHLMAGLAICAVCSAPMKSASVRDKHGKSWFIYRCHSYRHAATLDRFVSRVALLLLCNPRARELLRVEKTEDTVSARHEADAIRVRLEEAATMFAQGDITASQFKTTTALLRDRLQVLEVPMTDNKRARVLEGLTGDAVSVSDVVQCWEGLSLARKRAVIDCLMTVTLHPVGRGNKSDTTTIDVQLKSDVATILTREDLRKAVLHPRLTDDQCNDLQRLLAP